MHESNQQESPLSQMSTALRILAVEMVEKAQSGHPGMPLGIADIITVLFRNFLKFNAKDPTWINRDRFVLSAGHGSAVLYSALYLLGYKNYTLEQLKNFRQLGSITAGHPEYDVENGIETSTGPLGQGVANAVGMAIASKNLQAKFGEKLINNKVYTIVGDGCLAEGISHEACSLAGHLKLNNLIVLFDNNNITIDGSTELSCSEDHMDRFKGYGFATKAIDGHNHAEISDALSWAQTSEKPVFISCKTTIGLGAGEKSGTSDVHGAPLGEQGIKNVKNFFNWNYQPFEVPSEILNDWRAVQENHITSYNSWHEEFENSEAGKNLHKFLQNSGDGSVLQNLKSEYLGKKEASRKSSGNILESLIENSPNLLGGSADLSKSNCTLTKHHQFFSANNYHGNFINYGVREHAMTAIMNGLAQFGGFTPYGSTFLVFSDYMRPAIRLAAMMGLHVIYVLTHDSIGLGEDGPTHQPVEHLASLRAIPNLLVLRPADAVETVECWQIALNSKQPVLLALSRQNLEPVRKTHVENNLCEQGGYKLFNQQNTNVNIFASGSEVGVALQVREQLVEKGVNAEVISVPSLCLLKNNTQGNALNVVIEAGIKQGWESVLGDKGLFFGVETFGASGKCSNVYNMFGLNANNITNEILKAL